MNLHLVKLLAKGARIESVKALAAAARAEANALRAELVQLKRAVDAERKSREVAEAAEAVVRAEVVRLRAYVEQLEGNGTKGGEGHSTAHIEL